MTLFATEFPVDASGDRAAFVRHVLTWLGGIKNSKVLDQASETDLDGEAPVVRAPDGEELRLRVLEQGGQELAIGFRHDIPDPEGRLWRTEAVLRRAAAPDHQNVLRLRTQCIARRSGARLDAPRRPYLIKAVLEAGWGGVDRHLPVSDQPVWLNDDADALELARVITLGQGSHSLPVVYVSATGPHQWTLTRDQLEKLAYDLGGVAHIVVEPDRAFSFHLRDASEGGNVYGGTIGVVLPGRGIRRRLFIGETFPDATALMHGVGELTRSLRSQMPSEGWDWTELQEQALRQHRERLRAGHALDSGRLTLEETEALYDEEIANLKEQVQELKDQLAQASRAEDEAREDDAASRKLRAGPEIYPGEVMDRLRAAAQSVCARADQDGLDARSLAVLRRFAGRPQSPALRELVEDIRRATRDPKRMAGELETLLSRHGYEAKSHNKHKKIEPRTGFDGLEALNLATTPSDKRGLMNMCKQVERTLGLTKLLE